VKLGLAPEIKLLRMRQPVNPPESGVMPGGFVFASGISQTNNQTYRSHGVMVTENN
jgi:hypothetical protein